MTQTEKRTRKVKTLTAPLSLQVFKKTFWQGFIVETHVLFHIAAISKLVHWTAPNLWTRPSVWPHKDASSETVSLTVVTLWAKNHILPWWYVQADRLTGENCTSSTVAAFNQPLSSLCLKLPCQQLFLWTVNGQKKNPQSFLWQKLTFETYASKSANKLCIQTASTNKHTCTDCLSSYSTLTLSTGGLDLM